MRRLASKQQKALLYVLQDYCCKRCGKKLDLFEADHIIKWSQGGQTETCNLQLLCPECHTEKTLLDSVKDNMI